jgi:hypothetical protein
MKGILYFLILALLVLGCSSPGNPLTADGRGLVPADPPLPSCGDISGPTQITSAGNYQWSLTTDFYDWEIWHIAGGQANLVDSEPASTSITSFIDAGENNTIYVFASLDSPEGDCSSNLNVSVNIN